MVEERGFSGYESQEAKSKPGNCGVKVAGLHRNQRSWKKVCDAQGLERFLVGGGVRSGQRSQDSGTKMLRGTLGSLRSS